METFTMWDVCKNQLPKGERMKRWIKKHIKIVVIALSIIVMGNFTWWLATHSPEKEPRLFILFVFALTIWVIIFSIATGLIDLLLNWWNED